MNSNLIQNPLLSILCITYNHEKYISKAINSFLEQEASFDFEIVIGEDCSTDKTLEIILEFQKIHPKIIKIIKSEKNVGVTENFRRTLAACRGKYVALCEGDDYWDDPKKIQTQVSFLESNPEYVLTYHDTYTIDKSNKITNDQSKKGINFDATKSFLIKAPSISTLTACFRNEIKEIPIEFNHAPILDICLWSLLGKYGSGKYLKSIKPSLYRTHDGGIFSPKSKSEKIRMGAQSYIALSTYHYNQKNIIISNYFTYKATELLSIDLEQRYQLKIIIRTIYRLFRDFIYGIILILKNNSCALKRQNTKINSIYDK